MTGLLVGAPDPVAEDDLGALADVDVRLDHPVLVLRHSLRGARLELLTEASGLAGLTDALTEAGWQRKGDVWARFDGFGATCLRVTDARRLGASTEELRRAFAQSRSIPRFHRLYRPRLADELLVHTTWFAARPDLPAPGFRAALRRSLLDDPSAWIEATGRSAQWGVARQLRAARHAFEGGRRPGRLERRRMRRANPARWAVAPGAGRPAASGQLVALSGIDGAGKSTQAYALAEALAALGYAPAVEWARVTYTPVLPVLADAVGRAVMAARQRPGPDDAALATHHGEPEAAAARAARRGLRERHPRLSRAWTTAMAVGNAVEHWDSTLPHLRAGEVVIRDRYTLDSVVHLRFTYGHVHPTSAEEAIVQRLSPAPLCAFLLDVPAEVAYRRKPDEYDVPELHAQAAAYRRASRELGVTRLDATRSPEAIAAEIAAAVWQRLPDLD